MLGRLRNDLRFINNKPLSSNRHSSPSPPLRENSGEMRRFITVGHPTVRFHCNQIKAVMKAVGWYKLRLRLPPSQSPVSPFHINIVEAKVDFYNFFRKKLPKYDDFVTKPKPTKKKSLINPAWCLSISKLLLRFDLERQKLPRSNRIKRHYLNHVQHILAYRDQAHASLTNRWICHFSAATLTTQISNTF